MRKTNDSTFFAWVCVLMCVYPKNHYKSCPNFNFFIWFFYIGMKDFVKIKIRIIIVSGEVSYFD